MRRSWLALAAAAALLSCGGDNEDSANPLPPEAVDVTVKPGRGDTKTVFAVSFRSGADLGRAGERRVFYEAVARGRQRGGCVPQRFHFVDRGRTGERVFVRLRPTAGEGSAWCRGRFRGRVIYHDGFGCPDTGRCTEPSDFVAVEAVVAQFSFLVE